MIALLFPKGGQWEREEVQNQEVVYTESQMRTFHFDINLSLERKMAVSCISAWNYLGNLLCQIGPIYCCQLHSIEDTENGHLFRNEEKCSLCFPVELWA